MQFKSVFLILSGLFIVQSSLWLTPVLADDKPLLKEIPPPPFKTAGNCVYNATDLKLKKAKFPAFLQKDPPVMFIRESFPVAALSFHVENGKILGEATYKLLFGAKKDNGYVSKICYDNGEMTVELELGSGQDARTKEYKVKIVNDTTIEVKGMEFKQASPQQFARVLNKLTGDEKPAEPSAGANLRSPPGTNKGKN